MFNMIRGIALEIPSHDSATYDPMTTPRTISAGIHMVGALRIAFGALLLAGQAVAQTTTTLAVGDIRERRAVGTAAVMYTVESAGNELVAARLDQRDIDVSIRVLAPDGSVIRRIDSSAGALGPEPILFSATERGRYRLEVTRTDDPAEPGGTFTVQLLHQDPWADTGVDRVRQLLNAWAEVSEWETGPGAVAAVVQDGLVIASAAYGLASLEHGLGLSARTVLDVGSVSKQFTDFAIVLLAQRGLLNLDDDIRTHLREVPNFGTPIRIRHLIHHMSGIREIYGSLALTGWQAGDGIVQEDALGLVTHMRELNFEPGTEYLYCNTAYMLLADIVSRASGKPFAAFMEDEIFGPLGMEFTTIMAQKGQVMSGAADSYALADGEWVRVFDNSGIQGAGGIYTTVGDLARWLYNFRTARVGGPAAIAQMQERGVLSDGDTLRYAFGLDVGTYRGLRTLAHSGSSAGYRARLLYFPDEDLGILQQANSALTATPALMEMLADAMLEEILEPAVVGKDDNGRTGNSTREEGRERSTWTPTLADLQALEGVYFSPELEATWTLRVDEGRLEARHARLEPLPLEPQAADRFSAPYPLNEISVERDSAGSPVALRVSNGRVRNLRFERR